MANNSFNVFLNKKISPFNKTIEVDPDKSISIRSILIGSISLNISTVKNILESLDVKSAILVCRNLSKKRKLNLNNIKYMQGIGSLFIKKNSVLNFGNSGTLANY